MGYIVENGKSALFYEEFINLKISSELSKEFSYSTSHKTEQDKEVEAACQRLEHVGDIFGLNLTGKTTPLLDGTLQTKKPSCTGWANDIPALATINKTYNYASGKYSFSNYTGHIFNNTHYYIDLDNNYIYINKLVDSNHYTFNNWLVDNKHEINIIHRAHTIKIDDAALDDLFKGESITSHIYRDGYTHQNIISMLTPVYRSGVMKGVFLTDVNISNLASSFFTEDRPFLWKFISLYVTDKETGDRINFHAPKYKTFYALSHQEDMTRYYTLHVKLDGLYMVISMLWLFMFYILSTLLLCRYTKSQFLRQTSLSKDNITDAMTGLYNRKIITPELSDKIRDLVSKNIAVTVVAIDSDGLKRINDTLGHHMGDKAIQYLGMALAQSIRKSDYGIRLGGDEFSLILIDNTLGRSHEIIARAQERLAIIDKEKMVSFSYGAYQLRRTDTLEDAMLKSDELLYEHKRNKYSSRK